MLNLRRAADRGHANHGWLNTNHTFSFANYYDPEHMGFRNLRVINEDRVAPGRGFGVHPHREMEILSYVLDGSLEHEDSMGNGSIIRPGEVQRMSAGTGVYHSEHNASKVEPVHFMQIWVMPQRPGGEPSYEQRAFGEEERRNHLRRVVDPGGADGAVRINADVALFSALLEPGRSVRHELVAGRHAWIQVARGSVEIAGATLEAGDGASTTGPATLEIKGREPSEVLVFDLG